MAIYSVDINGTFTATVEVEIDDALLKDITEEVEQDLVYTAGEQILQKDLDVDNFTKCDNIEIECVDYTLIDDSEPDE